MTCEFCGKSCKEFGDLAGAIVCGDCLGWYGNVVNPDIPQELRDLQEAIDLGDRERLEDAFGCDFPDL